ncbi:MAG: VacJ family lipoprotein [Pseudomonadota bacterium]
MPNAALIALTSPLLLGDVPEGALAAQEPARIATAPVTGFGADQANASRDGGLIALNWSLVAAQNQPAPDNEPKSPESEKGDEQGDEQEADNRIIVTGEYGPPENDPIERVNEESYRITQQLDEVFVEPVAYAYRDGLPGPLRQGLGNAVNNLREPNNALNFLLQGKFGKAFETLGRLLINSTLGIGGLIDIAEKPGIGLPYRRNGFANTMGVYGVGSGPYLYLPITGATSARDLVGSGLDQLLLPLAVGEPFNRLEFTVPFYVVSNLEDRLAVDEELDRIGDTLNPYAARRDTYLYRRAREIAELKGEEPPEPPAILEEVEGTGDFADPPQENRDQEPIPSSRASGAGEVSITAPANPVIITKQL